MLQTCWWCCNNNKIQKKNPKWNATTATTTTTTTITIKEFGRGGIKIWYEINSYSCLDFNSWALFLFFVSLRTFFFAGIGVKFLLCVQTQFKVKKCFFLSFEDMKTFYNFCFQNYILQIEDYFLMGLKFKMFGLNILQTRLV